LNELGYIIKPSTEAQVEVKVAKVVTENKPKRGRKPKIAS
jgi:hypothetical protein